MRASYLPNLVTLENKHEFQMSLGTGDPPRRYGATTGAILESLGKAMMQPGTDVVLSPSDWSRNMPIVNLKEKTMRAIDALRLNDIVVTISAGFVIIRSENYGVIARE